MPRKLARDILASFAIFIFVLTIMKGDLPLTSTVRPYVATILTESTDPSGLVRTARSVAARLLNWNPWSTESAGARKPGVWPEPDTPGAKGDNLPATQEKIPVSPAGGGPETSSRELDPAEPPASSFSHLRVDGYDVAASGLPVPGGAPTRSEANANPVSAASSGSGATAGTAEPAVSSTRKAGDNAKTTPETSEPPKLVAPVHGLVTYGFGYRIHPIYKRRLFHEGVDIAAPEGTPIRAAAGGRVERAGPLGTYGTIVEIDHGRGFTTLYAHCSRVMVRPGDRVRAGQKVAEVGSTGLSTGPHLHFEVAVHGRPRDPFAYLQGGRRDVL